MDYILNRVNYQTLIMMLSDAPRYVRDKSSGTDRREKSAEEEHLRKICLLYTSPSPRD